MSHPGAEDWRGRSALLPNILRGVEGPRPSPEGKSEQASGVKRAAEATGAERHYELLPMPMERRLPYHAKNFQVERPQKRIPRAGRARRRK